VGRVVVIEERREQKKQGFYWSRVKGKMNSEKLGLIQKKKEISKTTKTKPSPHAPNFIHSLKLIS